MIRKNCLIILFFLISAIVVNCRSYRRTIDFAGICQTENPASAEIEGFLYLPDSSDEPTLLVEKENGTGGFIKVVFKSAGNKQLTGKLRIYGEILKDENSCVLKVEKIELSE